MIYLAAFGLVFCGFCLGFIVAALCCMSSKANKTEEEIEQLIMLSKSMPGVTFEYSPESKSIKWDGTIPPPDDARSWDDYLTGDK